MGGITGLNYTGCEVVARREAYDMDWLWPLFRALEAEQLRILAEKADRERAEAEAKQKGKPPSRR